MQITHPRARRHGAARFWLPPLTAAAVVGAVLLASAPVGAQQAAIPTVNQIYNDSTGSYEQLPTHRGGFNLFAEEDLAGHSLRLTGTYQFPMINAGGLCPFANTAGDIFNTSCGAFDGGSTYFNVTPAWGVGIESYRKIRDVHPGIATMQAPVGYGTPWRISSVAPVVIRINAADGQFGRFYAGVTSATGEGCRDHSGFAGHGLPNNFTLTAALNCEVSWAGGEYDGIRRVPDEVWLERFQANPNAFQWNDYKIPRAELETFPFLGNNSTYGAFSDFPREVLARYGGATPKGSGPPSERGFPAGITVKYDAWKFDSPSLRNGAFVRWLIINESEKVYGQGIDYDDLVMGLDPGPSFPVQNPNGGVNIPKWGVHSITGGNWSGNCSSTFPRRLGVITQGCIGSTGATGARAASHRFLMILKSPLGDLRNKQLSDPSSPFYAPNSPYADDTITFNQWRRGGFGGAQAASWRRSDRATYGWMVGDEEVWLDGRQRQDISASNMWHWFLSETHDGTDNPDNIRFNRFVPGDVAGYGSWDWNNDGIQDTIKLPDCGMQGCAEPWGDTLPGGFANHTIGNLGNFLGFGPFAIAAGDTLEAIFYIGAVRTPAIGDTLAAKRQWENITKTYFANYSGATAAPVPVITPENITVNSAFLRDSAQGAQNVEIRIQLKQPPKREDAYLRTILDRLESEEGAAVRATNPGLLNLVRGRVRNNVAEVLIFKSCDNGVSWTHLADCTAAIAASATRDESGAPVGSIGWRWRTRIAVDSITGDYANYIFTDAVQGGRTFLYSVVTKTRGLADIPVRLGIPKTNGMDSVVTLREIFQVDVDTITSPLVASGPSTARVYAPISAPAGTRFATLDTSRTQTRSTSPVRTPVAYAVRNANISGTYRVRFGNRWIITRTNRLADGAQTTEVIRQSIYLRAVTNPADEPALNFVAAADTFRSDGAITNGSFVATPSAAQLLYQFSTVPRSTTNGIETYVDTIARAGYVIAKGTGGTDPLYIAFSTNAVSNAVTGYFSSFRQDSFVQNTNRFEGAAEFPGFITTLAGTNHARTPTNAAGLARSRPLIRAPGDTATTGVTNSFAPVFDQANSLLYQPGGFIPGGQYRIRWASDPFGPRVPFRLTTPAQLQTDMSASLAARPTAQSTATDESVRALFAALPAGAPANHQTRPLVQAKLPFTIYDRENNPATVFMFQRHTSGNVADSVFRNSRLLGTTGDTMRVAVPPDVWMPGDTLFMVENMIQDSTIVVGGNRVVVVRDSTVNGRVQRLPIQVRRPTMTQQVVIACASAAAPTRTTCNPLALTSLGQTGYFIMEAGWDHLWRLNETFDQNDEMQLVANATTPSAAPLSNVDMERIYVVPNPYVVTGGFDRLATNRNVLDPRVMFVNVPKEGLLRVYSVSGQLMQQLSWTQNDLVGEGSNTPTGDLPFILRTREGLDFGPGLYLYVLTAKGDNANGKVARGKFVIIR